MKNFVVFIFAIVIMAGCVENHYFYCLEYDENGRCKDWAEMDTDPRVDGEIPDNIKNDADGEKKDSDMAGDFENEDYDEEKNFDDDIFVDYCVSMVDSTGNTMAGEYKDKDDFSENPATILTIELFSQNQRKNCHVYFSAPSIPELDRLSIESTSMPIKKLPIQINGIDYSFFCFFTDISNNLHIDINRNSDLETIFMRDFSRK